VCAECDKGYQLQDGACLPSVRNCKEFDALGNCRWCMDLFAKESRIAINGTFAKGSCQAYKVEGKNADNPQTDMNCAYFKYYYKVAQKPTDISGGFNVCHRCKSGFYITNTFKCLAMSIANCVSYDATVGASENTVCLTCATGYRLSVDKKSCIDNKPADVKFLTPQCASYAENKTCVQCNEGFMLQTVGANSYGQTTYCFEKKHNDPNCSEVDAAAFTKTELMVCKTCHRISGAFAYPGVLGTQIKTCMPIAQRANCAVQNSGNFTLDYICTQCDNNLYFLDSNRMCQRRSNLNPDCELYKISEDACERVKTAAVETVVSDDSLPVDVQRLIANPPVRLDSNMIIDFKGWIMGCKVYADSATCHACYPPKYLNPLGVEYNTKCKTVNRKIDHCAWYGNDGDVCLECDNFYLLVDNQCILKTAQNCLEFEDPDTCKSCPSTFPIIDEDGNCGVDPNNPWCLEYDNSIPGLLSYECDVCMNYYYPNDSGICTRVADPIKACKSYWSDRVCKQCEEGYYLRYDGKFCDTNPSFDEQCVEFGYGTECSVCEFGYYLKNGSCTACPATEGCAYCNANNTTQCLMCRFGFDMNDKGECAAKDDNGSKEYVRTFFLYSNSANESETSNLRGLAANSSTFIWASALSLLASLLIALI
jgi:hypothetical protein